MHAYTDPEIVRVIRKSHHAGLIVASDDEGRVRGLLDSYVARFYQDFHASPWLGRGDWRRSTPARRSCWSVLFRRSANCPNA